MEFGKAEVVRESGRRATRTGRESDGRRERTARNVRNGDDEGKLATTSNAEGDTYIELRTSEHTQGPCGETGMEVNGKVHVTGPGPHQDPHLPATLPEGVAKQKTARKTAVACGSCGAGRGWPRWRARRNEVGSQS